MGTLQILHIITPNLRGWIHTYQICHGHICDLMMAISLDFLVSAKILSPMFLLLFVRRHYFYVWFLDFFVLLITTDSNIDCFPLLQNLSISDKERGVPTLGLLLFPSLSIFKNFLRVITINITQIFYFSDLEKCSHMIHMETF